MIGMPSMYHEGSYAELEAQMRRMREFAATRLPWLHMNARYRWGRKRWAKVHVERRNNNPSYRLPERTELLLVAEHTASKARVMLYEWPDFVDEKQVEIGIMLLRKLMYAGDVGRIVIPIDVQRQSAAV